VPEIFSMLSRISNSKRAMQKQDKHIPGTPHRPHVNREVSAQRFPEGTQLFGVWCGQGVLNLLISLKIDISLFSNLKRTFRGVLDT
jgi:hypothetical protein